MQKYILLRLVSVMHTRWQVRNIRIELFCYFLLFTITYHIFLIFGQNIVSRNRYIRIFMVFHFIYIIFEKCKRRKLLYKSNQYCIDLVTFAVCLIGGTTNKNNNRVDISISSYNDYLT